MDIQLSVAEFEAISQIMQRTPLTQMEAVGWRTIVASAQRQVQAQNEAAQVAEAEAIGAAMDRGDQAELAEQANLVEADELAEQADLVEDDATDE